MPEALDYHNVARPPRGAWWWLLRTLTFLCGACHVLIGLAGPVLLAILIAKLVTGSHGNPLNISGHPGPSVPEHVIITRMAMGAALLLVLLLFGIAMLIASIRPGLRSIWWARLFGVLACVVVTGYCIWMLVDTQPQMLRDDMIGASATVLVYVLVTTLSLVALRH